MTENLKFIVAEVNKLLKSDYNLISFDSLSVENLLQLLLDVLNKFGASIKYNVKDSDPADTNKHILDSLKKIQYRPSNADQSDPTAFRRSLLQGDRKTIYPVLQFIFQNTEKIKNVAYLAQFLIPLNLPPEAMANPEIAALWNDYVLVMNEFKETHKAHSDARKDSDKFHELRSDIGIIESEKENVKKRLERTQSRLDKIPQQDLLLEAAHALRVERDRQKELQSQLEDQRQTVQKASTLHERLLKELNTAHTAAQDTSPQFLMESLEEETQVLKFMVSQKLPQEIKGKQSELQILEETINNPNITREYLKDLQDQVDRVGMDVQRIVESQLNVRGNQTETLGPFRQQAATVLRNKQMAADQLDQCTQELREVELQIRQKQELLQETVGGTILRGEDLKEYVNKLRAKSSIYKQQRAELAALKVESADLQQTLENLKQQDPTLSASLAKDYAGGDEAIGSSADSSLASVETRGITEIARLVDGLTRAVLAARERATPLAQQLAPLRMKVTDLKDERDIALQSYNALSATLGAETAVMQGKVAEINTHIRQQETIWKELQSEHSRIELLLAQAQEEQLQDGVANKKNEKRVTLKETLTEQINEQEQQAERLLKETEINQSDKGNGEQQQGMWSDLNTLLSVKLQCIRDAQHAGAGGTLFVQKGAETFTLQ